MKVEVLFFGVLAEKAGLERLSVKGANDVGLLKRKIFGIYPELGNYSFRVSVNRKLAEDKDKLKEGDEVALLPPFAGG